MAIDVAEVPTMSLAEAWEAMGGMPEFPDRTTGPTSPVVPFPKRYRRGEIMAPPADLDEAEQQILYLRRAVRQIREHLTEQPDESCRRVGMTEAEFPLWRERAERALGIKVQQLEERELWVRQEQRARARAEHPLFVRDADGAIHQYADHGADLLIAQARDLLLEWREEFEEDDLDDEERAVLDALTAYVTDHPAQTALPLAGDESEGVE